MIQVKVFSTQQPTSLPSGPKRAGYSRRPTGADLPQIARFVQKRPCGPLHMGREKGKSADTGLRCRTHPAAMGRNGTRKRLREGPRQTRMRKGPATKSGWRQNYTATERRTRASDPAERENGEGGTASCPARCGRRGIRTPGALQLNGFQDRRDRPLRHPSGETKVVRIFHSAKYWPPFCSFHPAAKPSGRNIRKVLRGQMRFFPENFYYLCGASPEIGTVSVISPAP